MNNSQFTISGGEKTAWHNKGRTAALKGREAKPPESAKQADWYMKGFRTARTELARTKAETI